MLHNRDPKEDIQKLLDQIAEEGGGPIPQPTEKDSE